MSTSLSSIIVTSRYIHVSWPGNDWWLLPSGRWRWVANLSGSTRALPTSILEAEQLGLLARNWGFVREYLVLQAGAGYYVTLRQGFIAWLKRLPGGRRQYVDGDDMTRAALVDGI